MTIIARVGQIWSLNDGANGAGKIVRIVPVNGGEFSARIAYGNGEAGSMGLLPSGAVKYPHKWTLVQDVTVESPATQCAGSPLPANWRAWQHAAPGDCPCGIRKSACHYHRET